MVRREGEKTLIKIDLERIYYIGMRSACQR